MGSFQEDKLVEAQESFITGHTFNGDILNLQFHQKSGPIFRFCPSTLHCIPCPWLQEDPYERKVVYARPSKMDGAGDGLFLRRDVPEGSLVSFYNGIRIMPGDNPPFESVSYQIYLDWKTTANAKVSL